MRAKVTARRARPPSEAAEGSCTVPGAVPVRNRIGASSCICLDGGLISGSASWRTAATIDAVRRPLCLRPGPAVREAALPEKAYCARHVDFDLEEASRTL